MILTHGANSLIRASFKLPEHCILLDYFVDGYRGGIQAIQNDSYTFTTGFAPYDSSSDGHIKYFDISKTPFEGLPYARFANNIGETKSNTGCLTYRGFSKTLYPNGISAEFLARLSGPEASGHSNTPVQYFEMEALANFTNMTSYNSTVGSYLYENGSYSLNWTIGYLRNVLTSDTTGYSWHHFAVTFDYPNNKMYLFIDGYLSRISNHNHSSNYMILHAAAASMYNPSILIRSYDIAQLAIWDYPKYKESFDISHDLIGWV